MRVNVKRLMARQMAGLAFAGLLIVPLVVFSSGGAIALKGAVLAGETQVVDGDTIQLSATRIRLEGIDAPETTQACGRAAGGQWQCGEEAARYLVRLTDKKAVRCIDMGPDKYGRTLGRCYAGEVDLGAAMVRAGHAWAFIRYSRSYVAEEAAARVAGIGIWQGAAMPAWEYRAQAWAGAEAAAPRGCSIKGNVAGGDRIYHMPWSPWYNKVRMDDMERGGIGRGKRWFCSEGDAIAAGWRPAITR